MTVARRRGVIALLEENCTSCMLCARECPDWCIFIESHTEPVMPVMPVTPVMPVVPVTAVTPVTPPAGSGARQRTRNVLDRFAIDYSLCMYCGICVEVCPFDALFWAGEVDYAQVDLRELTHERDRLAGWLAAVPPPPAADPGAAEPGELSTLRGRNTGAGPTR